MTWPEYHPQQVFTSKHVPLTEDKATIHIRYANVHLVDGGEQVSHTCTHGWRAASFAAQVSTDVRSLCVWREHSTENHTFDGGRS